MKIRKINNYFVAENAVIYGEVVAGENANIWYGTSLRADLATIRIGKYTNIQDNCVLHTDPDEELIIGEYVTIGHGAIIHGKSIGDYTLVGMGSILLAGSIIGCKCIIAAGCVIKENQVIPDNSIVAGVPGKIIRHTTDDIIEDHKERAQRYYRLALKHSE